MINIRFGLYRHYKGNCYYLCKTAQHSETREMMAVYQCLYGDYSWWVRPLTMFLETVDLGGESIPRFQYVRELSFNEISEFSQKGTQIGE